MIVPWFGPLPEWSEQYFDNTDAQPIDWLFFFDLDEFKQRVGDILGIKCPITPGSGKIFDFRPAFGLLFADELRDYDYWGHTDMDCVYGRLDKFYAESDLADFDALSDHTHYLCGPWTLYRNTPYLAQLFLQHANWKYELEDPFASGWIETGFTEVMNESGLRVQYNLRHAWRTPAELHWDGEMLMDGDHEVPFFHFRYTKQWPKTLV